MLIKRKQAAMFGLDARIALAIFGALSVISGAALYSAIQNAKATAMLAEMREVSKAWEQYLLDVGSPIPVSSSPAFFKIELLIENKNSIKSWNGPYLAYSIYNEYSLKHHTFNYIQLFRAFDTDGWGDKTVWTTCSSEINCYMYLQFSGLSDNLFDILDERIDNSDGMTSGDFRMITDGVNANYYILKVASVANL